MLLLKTNPELKIVFEKLIKTVKTPVTWKDIFAIKNNKLILVGEIRSLIFDFDKQTVQSNILDIPTENEKIDNIPSDALINNMLNIVLYAFGKWGAIGGLTVEKDYAALNVLFQNVFHPIGVDPEYGNENFSFFKSGVKISYEDVLQETMELLRREVKVPEEDSEEDASKLGLWHSMCWKVENSVFEKSQQSESDAEKSRIGRNFYMTAYQCPQCGEKLHMAVYPVDKELLIETEEARVFMARAYTCNACNLFYTPRPGKLIQEGEVYSLKFNEDRIAYEDYLEVLGEKAEKTVNSKFNEYEFQRKKKKNTGMLKQTEAEIGESEAGEPEAGEPEPEGTETRADSVQTEAVQTESMGTEQKAADEKQTENQEESLSKRGFVKGTIAASLPSDSGIDTEEDAENSAVNNAANNADSVSYIKTKLSVKTTEELKNILKSVKESRNISAVMAASIGAGASQDTNVTEYIETVKSVLEEKLIAKYEARMGALDNLSLRQLSDLKKQLQEEEVLPEEEKERYIKKLDSMLYQAEEKVLEQKVELGKNKTYDEIGRIIEEVEKRDCPEELKEETIKKLKRIRASRAEREVEHLIQNIPLHLDRKQLAVYLDKLEQYKEVDLTPYRKRLEERKDMAEKEEIAAFVKRGGKKDRAGLWEVYEQLQEQDYKKANKEPFLEKIYEKIRKMDEEKIDRICPSITSLSFREGLEAYEKISEGMFLPEIKTNALEMIERRLVKLKTDESVQLMRKLRADMEEVLNDLAGFYFYDAREEQRREQGRQESERWGNSTEQTEDKNEEKHLAAMRHAVNGYAAGRDPYEYPILVGDTTRSGSGKDGFVLTPDHVFYHTRLNTGVVSIMDIEKVEENRSIFGKGIYLWRFTGKKVKLPNPCKKEEMTAFAKILHEFVSYLQERPDSRSIEYLAKEKHEVKCCYRCGFNYRGGNICPKCGSKKNN